MSMDLSNIMNMLSSTSMDGSDAASADGSAGQFFGELLGQLKGLGLNAEEDLDPTELIQQISTFLDQNQSLSEVNLNMEEGSALSDDIGDLGQQFLQQLKSFNMANTGTGQADDNNMASAGLLQDFDETLTAGNQQKNALFNLIGSKQPPSDSESELSSGEDGFGFGSQFPFQKLTANSPLNTPTQAPPLEHPVGEEAWQEGLGDRVQWMVKSSVTNAELKLNPANLGPLDISVKVDGDQTSITFTSQHAAVREAVEAALPKLREMLSSQQLSLDSVEINQQHSQTAGNEQRQDEQYGWERNQGQNEQLLSDENDTEQAGDNPSAVVTKQGLVSYYA